ncbi:MAG: PIG-L family deacetylase [Pirellulales bacterium]
MRLGLRCWPVLGRSLGCGMVFWLLAACSAFGAEPVPGDLGAAGLFLSLQRLGTTATVLHVVAHPDDEDGALLTYLARGQGARTILFSLTRGEGGANLISGDFFDALGILRTLEHAEANRYYGSEVFYSRAVDYGFSKTLAEARRQWNEQALLGDLVRVIRRERPQVIVARFRGDERDGHGHHQMAGVLARRAFEAAGDPEQFSEQLADGLGPWQPLKLYVGNIRGDAGPGGKEGWTVALPTGDYNPLLGRSYAQVARHGLSFQRSQGMGGFELPAGPSEARYRLIAFHGGDVPEREDSLFDGIDVGLDNLSAEAFDQPEEFRTRLSAQQQIFKQGVADAQAAFSPVRLDACVPSLVRGLAAIRAMNELVEREWNVVNPEDYLEFSRRQRLGAQLRSKQRQCAETLARALALEVSAIAESSRAAWGRSGFDFAVPGQSLSTPVAVVHRSQFPVRVLACRIVGLGGRVDQYDVKLGYNELWEARPALTVPADAAPTRPAWRRASIREAQYDIPDPKQLGQPLPSPPLVAEVDLEVEGVPFTITRPVEVRVRDGEFGAATHPLAIAPAISVRFNGEHGVVRAGQREYRAAVELRSNAKGPAQGRLRLETPPGWRCEPESHEFRFTAENEEARVDFTVHLPEDLPPAQHELRAVAEHQGREYREGFRTITARDLGRCNYYQDAVHRLSSVDVAVPPDLKLAYVMGSGDDVPRGLEMLGARPTLLSDADLASADLSGYDAVLVGVRAYAVRPALVAHNQRLLEYAARGGVVIVQYQTPEFDHNFGPFPYTMGSAEEVSEESAAVTLLDPAHLLFREPNRVTTADFEGWLEQRGSKFWATWDDRYLPLLESHDEHQAPQRGGLLYARHGRGAYVYAAYAFYRQLPSGVPGAYRLMANLVSLRRTLPNSSN